jgi:hypothetical protein
VGLASSVPRSAWLREANAWLCRLLPWRRLMRSPMLMHFPFCAPQELEEMLSKDEIMLNMYLSRRNDGGCPSTSAAAADSGCRARVE